jgi:hypothetical protein
MLRAELWSHFWPNCDGRERSNGSSFFVDVYNAVHRSWSDQMGAIKWVRERTKVYGVFV